MATYGLPSLSLTAGDANSIELWDMFYHACSYINGYIHVEKDCDFGTVQTSTDDSENLLPTKVWFGRDHTGGGHNHPSTSDAAGSEGGKIISPAGFNRRKFDLNKTSLLWWDYIGEEQKIHGVWDSEYNTTDREGNYHLVILQGQLYTDQFTLGGKTQYGAIIPIHPNDKASYTTPNDVSLDICAGHNNDDPNTNWFDDTAGRWVDWIPGAAGSAALADSVYCIVVSPRRDGPLGAAGLGVSDFTYWVTRRTNEFYLLTECTNISDYNLTFDFVVVERWEEDAW